MSEEIRRVWHCGYMDESEWIGEKPADGSMVFGDEKYNENICPGYLVNQPLVWEIVAAWRDYDSGNWQGMQPNASAVLEEGVRHFASCVDSHRAYVIRQRDEERKRNGNH